MERLYVENAYQRMGAGSALITKAEEVAREMDFKLIWLSVLENNYKALAFYGRLGYRKIGRHLSPAAEAGNIQVIYRFVYAKVLEGLDEA